jgi:hypothetical protein
VVESVVETSCSKQFTEILKRTNELFETGVRCACQTIAEFLNDRTCCS